jgi:hypothetical protein
MRELKSCRISVSLIERERDFIQTFVQSCGLSISRIAQDAVREFISHYSSREQPGVLGKFFPGQQQSDTQSVMTQSMEAK